MAHSKSLEASLKKIKQFPNLIEPQNKVQGYLQAHKIPTILRGEIYNVWHPAQNYQAWEKKAHIAEKNKSIETDLKMTVIITVFHQFQKVE